MIFFKRVFYSRNNDNYEFGECISDYRGGLSVFILGILGAELVIPLDETGMIL